MKFLFSTRLRFFWVVIPMLALMYLALVYNDSAENQLKFYPLIVFLGGAVIFTFVYLFRMVGVAFDEVRTVGLFSSRERVMINEGKTLSVTLLPKKKLKVELFGNDGVLAELDWLVPNEDGTIPDINLFRAKALGSKRSALGIIKFYGVNDHELASKLLCGSEEYEDELVRIFGDKDDAGLTRVNVYFKATV